MRDESDPIGRNFNLTWNPLFLGKTVDLGLGQLAGADSQSDTIFQQQIDGFDFAGVFRDQSGCRVKPFVNIDLLLNQWTETLIHANFDYAAGDRIGRTFGFVAAGGD